MSRVFLLAIASSLLICARVPAFGVVAQDEPSSEQTEKQQDKSASKARAGEMSSSKDTRIDLAPPKDDAKKHPDSGTAIVDADDALSDVQELHTWDPHKAAKDIEVGDYYFKRKNYRAARERYKDALIYKPNDALANYRLAECEEKSGNSDEAVAHYQEYLQILPHGPLAGDAQKALLRMKAGSLKQSSAN